MPFHLEISQSYHRAWVFNLSEQDLARSVLDPWRRDAAVLVGGREWQPRDCGLTILDGPHLEPSELAYGRGWQSAQRSGTDVTARALTTQTAAPVALLAVDERGAVYARALLANLHLAEAPWPAVRATLMASAATETGSPAAGAGIAGAVLICGLDPPTARWRFDAGLALGAFGAAAILMAPSGAFVPEELQALGALDPELDPEAAAEAIARRLSAAIAPGGLGPARRGSRRGS